MPGTGTMPRGSIKMVGMVHGALNTIVTMDSSQPSEWEFKQFVSQEELEHFAEQNELTILLESKE